MHESGNVISLRFTQGLYDGTQARHQLTFCYQCHCAVDLRTVSRSTLRSGHWTRLGTCPHCGTTVTKIVRAS
ncbi:MAG TPA: hypothetical protein VET65_10140 [Candidatus Limnocylindrales bacterium]|nr:hypothetical protein [Candidatus Limnocylindrales bacterium]